MMNSVGKEKLNDICQFCISYLLDKCAQEKGLFRSTVSATEARVLQSQIAHQAHQKYREDLDPNLVAEVLISSLKAFPVPLMFEVYDDILKTGKI